MALACAGRFVSTVALKRELCRDHYLIVLRPDGPFPATEPGQFIQVGCRPPDEVVGQDRISGAELAWSEGELPGIRQVELCERLPLLRRPFSLADRYDDRNGALLDIICRNVGVGTAWLSDVSVGDRIDLIGPLGRPFRLSEDRCHGLLVGGGVGLPPMFYLARLLRFAGWDAIAFTGAMTRDLLAVDYIDEIEPDPSGLPNYCIEQFARYDYPTVVCTDDGSIGLRGKITDGLQAMLDGLSEQYLSRAVIFACGPHPMLRAVAEMASRYHVDCQVCMEQVMACGMGTCQSCIVKIDPTHDQSDRLLPPHGHTPGGRPWRYMLTCKDGPVFNSDEVIW